MALIVQKFGGTSVGSVDRINAVAELVINARKAGNDIIVVVSAMSGETDRLLELATEVSNKPNNRELDVLLATGEQVTIALLSMALGARNYPARSYTGAQVHIRTDNAHNKARILDKGHGYCLFNCPKCEGKPEILQGGEIKIVGVECV